MSSQSWWQRAAGDGTVVFPQTLGPDGVGGHLHVETCFPVNRRVDGRVHFDVMVASHQGFTGRGDKLDIGLAPGGDSMAQVPIPDPVCGPKPAKCMTHVAIDIDTGRLPSGLHSLRFRVLKTEHPNGERQFVGTEWPLFVRANPGSPGEVGGKGWYTGVDYANARIRGGLPDGPQSGVFTFDAYAKGDHVVATYAHVDARFGDDDQGTIVARQPGEYRGPVSFDTRRFTNGWHCLSVRVDTGVGNGGVNTGILEVPLLIDNPGAPAGNGTGSCFPMEAAR
jgi:hypothetical protein